MKRNWVVSLTNNGQYKLNVKSGNGQTVATFGETFVTKRYAIKAASMLSKTDIMQELKNEIAQALLALEEGNISDAKDVLENATKLITANHDKVITK